MLTVIVFIALCYLWCKIGGKEQDETLVNSDNDEIYVPMFIIVCIFFMAFIICKFICMYGVIFSGPMYLERYDLDQGVYEERLDNYEKFIQAELSSYPGYEKGIFKNLNSDIVLAYPQIKNDKVLMEKVNKIIELKDRIVDIKLQRNKGKILIKLQKKVMIWL